MISNKIKVLIVDDSALVRRTLRNIFESDPEIEVTNSAADPYEAVAYLKKQKPDVIILDVEMPRMDGITFLKKLMQQHPIPVVILSTLTDKGTDTAIKALEYGAVEVLAKPKLNTKEKLQESTIILCNTVKAASKANLARIIAGTKKKERDFKILTPKTSLIKTTEKIIVIGASTGGTEAIKAILMQMPLDCPAIAIVQHMPEIFTKQFAERLDSICGITVKEAKDGDSLLRGHALIAPGNQHMMVRRSGARYFVQVKDGPLVNRHRPAVDVLFKTTSRYVGKNAVGVIMTGMGKDGSKGMKEMYEAGAHNIAQNEQSCIVFGMPKEAIAIGGVSEICDLDDLAQKILDRA